jgi:hypothetical protein
MTDKKRHLIVLLTIGFFLFSANIFGQTYIQPTQGNSSSHTINCGSSYNYYDEGGVAGNYTTNYASSSVITFNPSVVGQFIQINFAAGPFDIEGCGGASCTCDWIKVYDGTSVASGTLLGKYCNGNIPGSITSSTGSLTIEFFADWGTVGSGWVATVSCSAISGPPLPIIQPSSGTSNATITCGSSTNYYDSGGSGSSYTNNENGLITICPSVAGQYVSISVNSFNLENNYDYLYVFDGNDASADIIGIYTGVIGAGAVITASSANSSGCLSFRFTSDGATVAAGWDLTVTCTATPAAPYPTSVEDCTGGTVVCGDGNLTGGTTGAGFQELPGTWNSCLNFGGNGEIQSNWYIFSPATNGTIGFLISPNPAADYDWTIWGPYNSLQCPAFTNDAPLRCSAASLANSGPNGETGLAAPAVDVIEASGGDGYLQPLTVIAGEIYVMMLDNWDGNSNPFTLSWQLSNGATLDCSPPLPVSLTNFTTQCIKNKTLLKWSTESEINNNFFVIEKSGPNFEFKEIGKVFGSGTSNVQNNYTFTDTEINNETAYYRLLQVDFDGAVEYHRIVASNCHNYLFNVVKSNLKTNNLELLITSSTNENLTIRLFNSTGKLITKQTKEINSGNNLIFLKDFNISTGIYLISIQGEFNNYSEKLLAK